MGGGGDAGDGFVVLRRLQEVIDDQSPSWQLGATLFVAFGALAVVVAAVGLYGVIGYTVAQIGCALTSQISNLQLFAPQ